MEKEYIKEYFLIPGESNAQQEMPLTLLVSRVIEIATEHANTLGIGYSNMNHLNTGWVLSRLTVEMLSYPKVNETYRIITWIESWNRHFSERNFEIQNQQGATIGYVRSVWMVINTITHENAGTVGLPFEDSWISERLCPISKQGKLRPVDCVSPNEYRFGYTDIDFYRHVNTVRYIGLLLNQFTMDDYDRNMIRRFEIAFMHEGHYGQNIKIKRSDESGNVNFELVDDDVALLRSRFSLYHR